MSVLDTLAAATPNRRSVKICVNGALQAEWDALVEQLPDVVVETSLAAENVTAVAQELEAMRGRIAASEVTFEFEQLEWTKRIALQAAHAPRPGHFVDGLRGFNVDTYTPLIIRKSCVAVVGADGDRATEIPDPLWTSLFGDPGDPDDPERPPVKGSLNAKQVNDLLAAAIDVNDGVTSVPPSARSLLQSQDSGASSAQPSPGTSPRSGSAAGSRRTSRKSSTAKKAPAKKAGSSGT